MGKLVKLGVPVLVVAGLGVFGWLYPESSGNTDEAGRAVGAVMDAADQAIDSACAGDRYQSEKEDNFVNIGAIFTSNGNVRATLVVRGTDGARPYAIEWRSFGIILLSDYPPAASDLSAGSVGFGGSMTAELNGVIKSDSVSRVRFHS